MPNHEPTEAIHGGHEVAVTYGGRKQSTHSGQMLGNKYLNILMWPIYGGPIFEWLRPTYLYGSEIYTCLSDCITIWH